MKTQEKQAIPALAAYCLAGLLAATAAIPAGEAGHAKTGTAPKTYQRNSKESPLAPTLANVRYGEHQGNTLDSWKAGAEAPTPLIMILHGGGWTSGSKENVARRSAFPDIRSLLGHGISVAAINYRLIGKYADGVVPPVKAPLHDAARALQFIRSKARNGTSTRNGSALPEFQRAPSRDSGYSIMIKNALFIKTTDFARPAELSPNPTHGHHWCANADSYFLIGEAAGGGMKSLLK